MDFDVYTINDDGTRGSWLESFGVRGSLLEAAEHVRNRYAVPKNGLRIESVKPDRKAGKILSRDVLPARGKQ